MRIEDYEGDSLEMFSASIVEFKGTVAIPVTISWTGEVAVDVVVVTNGFVTVTRSLHTVESEDQPVAQVSKATGAATRFLSQVHAPTNSAISF